VKAKFFLICGLTFDPAYIGLSLNRTLSLQCFMRLWGLGWMLMDFLCNMPVRQNVYCGIPKLWVTTGCLCISTVILDEGGGLFLGIQL
jgi:hypothetical protein